MISIIITFSGDVFIIISRLAGTIYRGSTFSQTVGAAAVTDSAWCNFGRFRRGRALIWQPITMPPAIATNPVAELRSGYGGRIGTNSGGGVRFGTTL